MVVLDTAGDRLEVAAQLGADATINPRIEDVPKTVQAALGGEPPSIVVDAVGHPITRQQALALAAPGGTVVLLGLAEATSDLDLLSAINREIRLQCSYASDDGDFRDALSLIADKRVDVTSWVEHFTSIAGRRSSHGWSTMHAVWSKRYFCWLGSGQICLLDAFKLIPGRVVRRAPRLTGAPTVRRAGVVPALLTVPD